MNKLSVLVIEDELPLRNALRDKFVFEGYDVYVAGDGIEGLEQFRAIKPDIILLDIMMPRLNGINFLKELKQSKELATVPVIVLSNIAQVKEEREAVKLGASDYLIKSDHSLSDLVALVGETIKKFTS